MSAVFKLFKKPQGGLVENTPPPLSVIGLRECRLSLYTDIFYISSFRYRINLRITMHDYIV